MIDVRSSVNIIYKLVLIYRIIIDMMAWRKRRFGMIVVNTSSDLDEDSIKIELWLWPNMLGYTQELPINSNVNSLA